MLDYQVFLKGDFELKDLLQCFEDVAFQAMTKLSDTSYTCQAFSCRFSLLKNPHKAIEGIDLEDFGVEFSLHNQDWCDHELREEFIVIFIKLFVSSVARDFGPMKYVVFRNLAELLMRN